MSLVSKYYSHFQERQWKTISRPKGPNETKTVSIIEDPAQTSLMKSSVSVEVKVINFESQDREQQVFRNFINQSLFWRTSQKQIVLMGILSWNGTVLPLMWTRRNVKSKSRPLSPLTKLWNWKLEMATSIVLALTLGWLSQAYRAMVVGQGLGNKIIYGWMIAPDHTIIFGQ